MKLLITGGAGFMGSNFVERRLEAQPDDRIVVLDKLTYAGRRESLREAPTDRLEFIEGDICDAEVVSAAIEGCDASVNFAAESHVDRSITRPGEFIETDVFGTHVMLDAARKRNIRHLQISTDEVYGDFGDTDQSATEISPLDPSSPYAASKAGGDLLVGAFARTYGSDALIVRASNNYGPRQHPEKLIPLSILNALAGDQIPVYGDGTQIRNWLHVEDFCRAIDLVLERGIAGEIYNVGGPDELTNIEVVNRIVDLAGVSDTRIEFIEDRPGHDLRYSLASDRLEALGWKAEVAFDEGIEKTFAWYRDNRQWWQPIRSGEYHDYYLRQYGKQLGGEPAQ